MYSVSADALKKWDWKHLISKYKTVLKKTINIYYIGIN